MEVYGVAKMGRPKSANPKNTLIGLKLTEEEATKLREYASKHDMTVTEDRKSTRLNSSHSH